MRLLKSCRELRRRSAIEPSEVDAKFNSPIMADLTEEETDNPSCADDDNFYKLEKWTKDGTKVDRLLYAGNDLEKAQDLFAKPIKHRPKRRPTIRQRTQVLDHHP
jgi:hypothetical protein